ncbi:unnamed protein product [Lota lota]
MEPNFRCIVAIVFIFTCALGAPAGDRVEDACSSVQSSSSWLNKIARILSVETRIGIANVTNFSSNIPWMETQDKCDPGSLSNNPTFSATTVHHMEEDEMWEAADLCHYIMERLFSFSIISARVFALGDPAKHSHGSAGQCM